MPYQLKVENTSGWSQNCHFCDQRSCGAHCGVPFSSSTTVLDLLHKVGQEDNVSFYNGKGGKHDVILNLVWNSSFNETLMRHCSSNQEADKVEGYNEAEESDQIQIGDCFSEFSKTETLDQDNMWYCNKCKEHVRATKKLELYKVPPVICVNLKRFKQSKRQQSYGYFSMGGSVGQKADQLVEFPLEGLDLSEHVIGSQKNENLIYDCYAVSNHYGSMGFGHYTAFCKNAVTK